MAVGSSASASYLRSARSASAPAIPRSPTSITVHPVALFSILDHYLRRTDSQNRVIGTLLGTRSENGDLVDVKTAFAVLHSETDEQVAVDMEYHHAMYDLCARVNGGKEAIVGWYSTGSNLNTYSALIQNFYSHETAPYPAIHIALNTGTEVGQEPGVKAYISSPVGVNPKPENAVFTPIPIELKFNVADRSGLDLLTTSLTSPLSHPTSNTSTPTTDLSKLESSLHTVLSMLDRVLAYVRDVLEGKKEGDKAIGRYLMDVFGRGMDEGEGWMGSLQDTLMMSYLANLVRAQAEVSSRLALVTSA